MTLRHLRVFVAVCDCGSMTAAAERLYLAQPAVSLAIGELERYYGIRLFDRISRRLYLTEAGKRLLSYARHITDLFEEMEQSVRDWETLGELRVGASITVGTRFLSGYVRRFAGEYPQIQVLATVENSGVIEQKVLSNEVDLGLIEGIVHSPDLVCEHFLDDELVLVCSPGHPLRGKGSVTLAEAMSHPVLTREKGSGTRELLDGVLMAHEISITPVWESISVRTLINGVADGLGISLLPRRLVEPEVESGALAVVPIVDAEFRRQYHAIYHKHKYLSEAAREFLRLCREAGENPEK